MDKVQTLLDKRIEEELEGMATMLPTEKADAISNVEKLYKLRIEESEAAKELELKKKQTRSQTINQWAQIGLNLGIAIGGWFMYNRWYKIGLKFEETGSITAPMTKNLLPRLFPRK